MDDLDRLHDYLVDAYQYFRMNKPKHALLVLGFARGLLVTALDERDVWYLYKDLGFIRDDIKRNWLALRDEIMADINMQVHKVYAWRECRAA